MKKKIFSLVTSLVMVTAFLSGCGTGSDTKDAGTATSSSSEIKAAFICFHDENSIYDLNYMNAAKDSCEKLGIDYVIRTNIPEGEECYDTACELAEEGYDYIFANSFGHEEFMIKAAKAYPQIQFAEASGTRAHTENVANFHNAYASIYDGRYLTGVAAGLKINEMISDGSIKPDQAKIGYIGAFTNAQVMSGYTAFYLGAKSVCPTVTMDVTFSGFWSDRDSEAACAQELIQNGCILLSHHSDTTGAHEVCEEACVYHVSYNSSTADICPNTYLTATRINWSPYFEYCLNAIMNKESIASDWVGTLENGSVILEEPGKNIAEGTLEKLEQVREELIAGSTHAFDTHTFTVKGKILSSYQADINTDSEYTPDHESILDGYFNESDPELRSAPYFDLKIDGITLLNECY